jgi:phosphatidylserine decarboxylase
MKVRREFLLPGTAVFFIGFVSFFITKSFIPLFISSILFIFLLNFFRDPEREPKTNSDKDLISPADGKVILKDEVEVKGDLVELIPEFEGKKIKRITIFMSPLDVHVNRAPISGYVQKILRKKGGFARAFLEKSENNSRVLWHIRTEDGKDVILSQIAGAIARRISVFKKEGDFIRRGERIGIIYIGSRVDVYVPYEWEFSVQVGDKVFAGKTKIGYINSEPKLN